MTHPSEIFFKSKITSWVSSICQTTNKITMESGPLTSKIYKGYLFFFSVKDQNLFHRVDTICSHSWKYYRWCSRDEINFDLPLKKKKKIFCLFHALTLSERSLIKIKCSSFLLFPVAYPFRIATQLQYYVKREKCKVNDVIFHLVVRHVQLT